MGRARTWLFRLVLLCLLLAALPWGGQAAGAQEIRPNPFGTFEYIATTNGILVAAPHGLADRNTARLAPLVAARLGAGYVLAKETTPGLRINVNRPTEGEGLACDKEVATDPARELFEAYARVVQAASGSTPLRLYVEIHGNLRPAARDTVQVAAKGIALEEAQGIRAAYPAILARVRAEWPGYPGLTLLIEPADHLLLSASCNKRLGILASPMILRALHFEFPASARDDALLPASAALAAMVIERLTGR